MTTPSEARQRADNIITACEHAEHWTACWDCIQAAIAAEVQRAVAEKDVEITGLKHTLELWNRECDGLTPRELVQRAVAVQQTKYDELRIQFQAAQEKIDQLRDEKQRAVDGEREACAEIAEGFRMPDGEIPTDTGMIWRHSAAVSIAKAIRARQRAGGGQA